MTAPIEKELVEEFQTAFDVSKDVGLWKGLVEEELAEVKEAFGNLLKETADLCYVMAGLSNLVTEENREDLEQFVRDLDVDKIDEILGYIADQPIFLEVFNRVHASNMSKLGDDGKPVRRDDGKILKGPNYKPPVFDDLL